MDGPQPACHLAGRAAHDQVANCSPRGGDVLVGAHDGHLGPLQHDAGLGRVLNRVLNLSSAAWIMIDEVLWEQC